MSRHRTRRCLGDDGQIAGIEALPFGVLTFVIGSLLVANAWAVVDAKLAVSAAASEAARVYVEAPDERAAAERAHAAAVDTVDGHGRNSDRLRLSITHDPGEVWGRCARVRVTAHYEVPAMTLPWIGGYGRAFDAVASHSEIVDPYRGGVAGEARC
jgi:hypothetical protein